MSAVFFATDRAWFLLWFLQEVGLIKGNKVTRVNRMIRIPQVMVVDENGEQLGVLNTLEAITIAEDRGLDLVEVAPTARPPVCKIMDYGRFKYEQAKKAKTNW